MWGRLPLKSTHTVREREQERDRENDANAEGDGDHQGRLLLPRRDLGLDLENKPDLQKRERDREQGGKRQRLKMVHVGHIYLRKSRPSRGRLCKQHLKPKMTIIQKILFLCES